ncbi:MAG TPA: alanine--glyoxylate aminotransferase family protein [Candidatus Elarobacter sp.]|nr:alanine--glyoxylate aminotransferase family protein [Candidatus Elarobacter sp.]
MTFGTFFLPGPTEVRSAVLQAMTRPMIAHRGAAFERLFSEIQRGLRDVFRTRRPVYVSASSATGMMEAGVRCAPAGRILSLVNGAFSERFAHIAVACGREIDRYDVAWGEVHDVDEVGRRLRAGDYAAITVVHSETSTGALNDIRAITDAARTADVRCLIDSVSGLGGTEVEPDAWGCDYVLTGSQKALALPPGLAFAVASQSFIDGVAASAPKDRGVYFDLAEFEQYASKNQTPSTPAISLLYALSEQLSAITREGMPARWARHAAMAARTYAWADEARANLNAEISVLAPAGFRSPTVTTITLPKSISGRAVAAAVAERGFTIGTGYGKLAERTIRIGHMGDHTLDGLERCLDTCWTVLASMR